MPPRIFNYFLIVLISCNNASCSASSSKFEALDEKYLKQKPIPANYIEENENGLKQIKPETAWFSDVSATSKLIFARLRKANNKESFAIVANVDHEKDEIVFLPLEGNETPLDILAKNEKKAYYLSKLKEYKSNKSLPSAQGYSLKKLIAENKLASPLPEPSHIFAVAANYPSHLEYDLGIKDAIRFEDELASSRPRVFLKYPLTIPAAAEGLIQPCDEINKIIGPFDMAYYHKNIVVPGATDTDAQVVHARMDYEAEIGAVIGKDLAWKDVEYATDNDILAAVAGYVLVNDAKARNPQVMLNVLRHEEKATEDNTYKIGNKMLDERLGVWDQQTSMWWSYAASWGGVHSIGPFFVTADNDKSSPERLIIGARSFGENRESHIPEDYLSDILYLRQLAFTTQRKDAHDGLIWSLPDIIRSILAPDSALEFYSKDLEIKKGDIISLGTPGGTVITVKAPKVFRIVEDLAIWLDPIDWHNLFFKGDAELYLEANDSIFMWATGLGYQQVNLIDATNHKSLCK